MINVLLDKVVSVVSLNSRNIRSHNFSATSTSWPFGVVSAQLHPGLDWRYIPNVHSVNHTPGARGPMGRWCNTQAVARWVTLVVIQKPVSRILAGQSLKFLMSTKVSCLYSSQRDMEMENAETKLCSTSQGKIPLPSKFKKFGSGYVFNCLVVLCSSGL